ncbi:outer membrane protein assembly factor BamB [Aestuariibacter halophilus]|uniref:Outer membrane protein assembly factor BamB n=1 Tax=Fluctibacter halophilus TaxID=226011 RepID=A0ABS8G389_9ALTE|nr:outer membrane protein assembly factor BamB [Aestuariibacter halophilus]MCC2614959.1 outer membrane protein assembly factor BamB [Aestuariibacter halophilus]
MRFSPLLLAGALALSGCSTVSDWFADDEELEVRRLPDIEARFTPQVVWEKDIDNGVDQYFSRLSPALGYGALYVANRQGGVFSLDPANGKTNWQADFATFDDSGYLSFLTNLFSDGVPAKISGGLTLAYETVYFGTEDGYVYALDAETGEQRWRVSVRGEVLARPAVDENVVVVNTGSGQLFGLDAASGEQLWRYESEVPALSLRGISAPAAANGGAIVGTASGKLAVTLLETGQTAWEQPIAKPSGATELDRIVDIDTAPVVFGGVIYTISYSGTLAAVELRSGRVMWKREYNSYQDLVVQGNQLFVVDTKSNVYSLDRRNGIEQWSMGRLRGRELTHVVVANNNVVVGDKFGFLHWLDRNDGSLVARLDVGGDDEDNGIYTAPVVGDDVLYLQTREGDVFAVSTPE